MKKQNRRRVMKGLLVLGAILFAAGCSGGTDMMGDDFGVSSTNNGPLRGVFLDSAVQGLSYRTPTQNGMTDANGAFHYNSGEMVTFMMGEVMLGQGRGANFMTPIDLVPGAVDETHPTVTNMLRFMQSIDEDGNPDNGITIPDHAITAMNATNIDFDMPIDVFEHDADMEAFMNLMALAHGTDLTMVSADQAQDHMRQTMMQMMGGQGEMMGQGYYAPSLEAGVFVDSPVEGLTYKTETIRGTTDGDGTFLYMTGEMVTFMLGDIELGEAPAAPLMTPIDLVLGAGDETHPTVTNMLRFMQSLDADRNPENGITIHQDIANEASGRGIHFDMHPFDFERDPDVEALMNTIYGMGSEEASLVPIMQAQNHMKNTLMDLMHPPLLEQDPSEDTSEPEPVVEDDKNSGANIGGTES